MLQIAITLMWSVIVSFLNFVTSSFQLLGMAIAFQLVIICRVKDAEIKNNSDTNYE